MGLNYGLGWVLAGFWQATGIMARLAHLFLVKSIKTLIIETIKDRPHIFSK